MDPFLFEVPVFPKTVSRMRSKQNIKFLHLNDNSQSTSSADSICKISPFLNYTNSKFYSLYKPKEELLLEGVILTYRVHISFRMHNLA